MNDKIQKKTIIQYIFSLNDVNEQRKFMIANSDCFQNIDIIINSPYANNILSQMTETISPELKDSFISPFEYGGFYFLNLNNVLFDTSFVSYTLDISLDTQIVSYINSYQRNKLNDEKLKSIVELICSPNKVVSAINFMPFLDENYLFECKLKQETYDTLYSVLLNRYKVEHTLFISKIKTKRHIKALLANYKKFFPFTDQRKYIYKHIYACLLKTFLIKEEKGSVKNKFTKFLEFECNCLNNTLPNIYNVYVSILKKDPYKLYGKIHKNNSNILANIKNMCWDINHLYTLKKSMIFKRDNCVDVTLPLLFTYDKGLKEISKLMKVKGVIVDHNSKDVDYYVDTSKIKNLVGEKTLEKLFCISSKEKRFEVFNYQNIDLIIEELEKELTAIYND